MEAARMSVVGEGCHLTKLHGPHRIMRPSLVLSSSLFEDAMDAGMRAGI